MVCLLRGGFSRVEQTLLEGGRGSSVIQQRMDFQDLMRERFEGVIEDATGRHVIGFMSGNQQDPDIMCEVFILAPTDLVDDHEIARPRCRCDRGADGGRDRRVRVALDARSSVGSGGHHREVGQAPAARP